VNIKVIIKDLFIEIIDYKQFYKFYKIKKNKLTKITEKISKNVKEKNNVKEKKC
jgi:hypothetical protein